jgi:general secretion pathway protein G
MLESALNIMRLDVGQVPPPEQGLQWLLTPPLDPNLQPCGRPLYRRLHPCGSLSNPYQYKAPGIDNKPYSVYSFGADGKPGGEGLNADIGLGSAVK